MLCRGWAVLAWSTVALAQTFTDCNPTEKSCPSDPGLATAQYSVDFTKGSSDDWNMTYGTANYGSTGAAITITKSGDAPTMQSNFYIFFGVVSFFVRAAPGTGIVSSAILESDDLDEIDWEWLGGSPAQVQTNYFGKGNTTSYDRGTYESVPGDGSQASAHNYTLEWTSAATTWYIDGTAVRTLHYADAVGGKNYPQTPMRVKLGSWAGGDSSQPAGTIQWAGGSTDYSQGPFTMYIERIDITNYNPAGSYSYGDLTGDWTSIKTGGAVSGSSKADGSSSSSSQSASSASASSSSSLVSSNYTAVASATSGTSGSAAATSSSGQTTKASATASVTTVPSSDGGRVGARQAFLTFGLLGVALPALLL